MDVATIAATRASNDRNDLDDFIDIVRAFMLPVAIAEGFFNPLSCFCLGFFATTAHSREISELKLLVNGFVDKRSIRHGFV